jgi:hypothetical protein
MERRVDEPKSNAACSFVGHEAHDSRGKRAGNDRRDVMPRGFEDVDD